VDLVAISTSWATQKNLDREIDGLTLLIHFTHMAHVAAEQAHPGGSFKWQTDGQRSADGSDATFYKHPW